MRKKVEASEKAQPPLGAATTVEGCHCQQLQAQPVVEKVRRATAASLPFFVQANEE
jgi:hypothetical protein